MPKGKKKSKSGGGGRYQKPEPNLIGSEEESNFDNASIVSIASDSRYGSEDGTLGDPDNEDVTVFDDFEDKLIQAIDGTSQKSAKGRQACLEAMKKAFTMRYLYDFIMERKITIGDVVERSLKKGKGEEQAAAAILATLVLTQLGSSTESEALFREIRPILLSAVTDTSVPAVTRAKCATSLGLCCFIAGSELEDIVMIMDSLHSVFSASYFKGNGAIPNHTPEITALHSSALLAWGLLLTVLSPSRVMTLADVHLKRLPELLESADVDLRIAAGETIALLYELARDIDESFEVDNLDDLCIKLRQLATDSQKFRAKKDRRQQRSSFRDVLRAVEYRDFPSLTVKFGRERLALDTWSRKRQYDAFCQVLGSGMNLHLTENDLLRDIFELGAPLTNGIIVHKVSKFERHMGNLAACKARTKSRGRLRDKRADVVG